MQHHSPNPPRQPAAFASHPTESSRLADLETRDELETAAQQLPNVISERFTDALAKVDDKFRSATLDADNEDMAAAALGLSKIDLTRKRGWWWRRLPDPPPWSDSS